MKVFDTVNNVELEADTKKLVDIMVDGQQSIKSVSSVATLWKVVSSASLLVTTSMTFTMNSNRKML